MFVTTTHGLLHRPVPDRARARAASSRCVSAFVGDQFDQTNKHSREVVFDAFYWIINFGSFFASLLMPIFLRQLRAARSPSAFPAC